MFKVIPGNSKLRMNPEGVIKNSFDKIVTYELRNGKIEIELFNEIKEVELEWLILLTRYEFGYIENLHLHLDKIKFATVDSGILRIPTGKIAYFTEPIYYKKGFRYIPCYPQYAINCKGDIYNVKNGKLRKSRRVKSTDYKQAGVSCPLNNRSISAPLHRLLALTWLPNDCFSSRPYINHKDGDKQNFKLDNLEWCSHSENVRHALAEGLNDTSIRVKSRNVETGEVEFFNSFSDFTQAKDLSIGRSLKSYLNNVLPGFLFKELYEVKALEDNTPWFYEGVEYSNFKHTKSYNIFTLINTLTGVTVKYNNVQRISELYGVAYKSKSISKFLDELRLKYPHYKITRQQNTISGPYFCLNLNTNELHTADSITDAVNIVGIKRSMLQMDLKKGEKFIYNNKWIVFLDIDTVRREDYKLKPSYGIKVKTICIETGVETTYSGMKPAARAIGSWFDTIKANVNTDNPVNGYLIRTLDQ